MHLVFIMILCLLSTSAWAEDCHVTIEKDELRREVVQGRDVYVVDVGNVMEGQCFKPGETKEYIEKLEEQIERYSASGKEFQERLDALTKRNQEYAQLLDRHEHTLTESVKVTDEFDKTAAELTALVRNYDTLVGKFDDLAGEYRKIEQTAGSPFSFDLGVGVTDEGDAVGLVGVGVRVYKKWNFKAWVLFHEDFSGFLAGPSLGF